MLAKAPQLLRTASISLVLAALLSGCQSAPPNTDSPAPPTFNTSIQTTSLSQALQQLESRQFVAAEADFQSILSASSDQAAIQQALAGLTLVYLYDDSPLFSLPLATATMDRLYQHIMRWPQNRPSINMLLLSLNMCFDQRLKLNQEIDLREKTEAREQQLINETIALQRAIEKLRRLTLH